jgi:hypothetical protein
MLDMQDPRKISRSRGGQQRQQLRTFGEVGGPMPAAWVRF